MKILLLNLSIAVLLIVIGIIIGFFLGKYLFETDHRGLRKNKRIRF